MTMSQSIRTYLALLALAFGVSFGGLGAAQTSSAQVAWKDAEAAFTQRVETLARKRARDRSGQRFAYDEGEVVKAAEAMAGAALVGLDHTGGKDFSEFTRRLSAMQNARTQLYDVDAYRDHFQTPAGYIERVRTAVNEAEASLLATSRASMPGADEAALVTAATAAPNINALDAVLRPLGFSWRDVCRYGPYIDTSGGPVTTSSYDSRLLPARLGEVLSERCLESSKAYYWSAGELQKVDPAEKRSMLAPENYTVVVPATYGQPTADDIRRALMRELLTELATVQLDSESLLVSGMNQVGSDINGAFARAGINAGMGLGRSGVSARSPGMILTFQSVRRVNCARAVQGQGYTCRILLDLGLSPNAAQKQIGLGRLGEVVDRFNAVPAIERRETFVLTRRGWRSPTFGDALARDQQRNSLRFYDAVAGASSASQRALCALDDGAAAWFGATNACQR